jgi:hypothetical protein
VHASDQQYSHSDLPSDREGLRAQSAVEIGGPKLRA